MKNNGDKRCDGWERDVTFVPINSNTYRFVILVIAFANQATIRNAHDITIRV